MTRFRFPVIGHGLGIEVRAENESLAWAALRSRFPRVLVIGKVKEMHDAAQTIPLARLVATEKGQP